ncbi:hypothetical protein [Pseudovibrio sp. SPO723]|uniref:hypothetical protein n=1 Tax=Nesiotobacter zosterae TaxID=392721 RepID=UPI0029C2CEBF|nr:hypothetical protein [Pseudovibrio sp. SPO723]MDX5592550.1 hypothetical protein [Pseudovibrio sp. SPO723]
MTPQDAMQKARRVLDKYAARRATQPHEQVEEALAHRDLARGRAENLQRKCETQAAEIKRLRKEINKLERENEGYKRRRAAGRAFSREDYTRQAEALFRP